ncbi:membrane protein [Thermaurantimonas aggregans]|uniref:Membrane protein n=1 Tax=Thermaurantimonas aggregans TaxID=2173829 RepID=A0A401XIT4_9FLAO|nr:zinc metallopeptidase [Thermaurantimonas aggregans]MCX8148844.1 zinc metallopeptidase [Thermaurantimonas aggregans]GCD76901.1 membrane protein [Thermaurantimonas aggregans]
MILILIVFALVGFIVQTRLKTKFEKYSKVPVAAGLTGAEVAEKMLHDHGIYDVRIISVPGKLTDHYNPLDKTVNLSPDVYHGRSVAAAAVAAHEVGHAVQHATAYAWLQMRSALVPIVSFSSRMLSFIFLFMLFGSVIVHLFPIQTVLLTVVILQSAITLFTIITLPVEYDASNRALVWLNSAGITSVREHNMAKDALKWAANTYLVAALASIAQLVYYILLYLNSRD